MRKLIWPIVAIAMTGTFLGGQAPATSPAMKVILSAADALGGKDRVLAIKTLEIFGYGQLACQNGGGNITASPDAPQKWVNINGSQRTIDVEHGRMRLQQRQVQDFVFAYEEVLALIRKQIANAQALCKRVDDAGLSMQGCPVTNAGF